MAILSKSSRLNKEKWSSKDARGAFIRQLLIHTFNLSKYLYERKKCVCGGVLWAVKENRCSQLGKQREVERKRERGEEEGRETQAAAHTLFRLCEE